MSIVEHPIWNRLRNYIEIQEVFQETNTRSSKPRIRIELKKIPNDLVAEALSLVIPCAKCGSPIHPIRTRNVAARGESVARHFYYACTCPLDVKIGCSRSLAASDEYERIRNDLASNT